MYCGCEKVSIICFECLPHRCLLLSRGQTFKKKSALSGLILWSWSPICTGWKIALHFRSFQHWKRVVTLFYPASMCSFKYESSVIWLARNHHTWGKTANQRDRRPDWPYVNHFSCTLAGTLIVDTCGLLLPWGKGAKTMPQWWFKNMPRRDKDVQVVAIQLTSVYLEARRQFDNWAVDVRGATLVRDWWGLVKLGYIPIYVSCSFKNCKLHLYLNGYFMRLNLLQLSQSFHSTIAEILR